MLVFLVDSGADVHGQTNVTHWGLAGGKTARDVADTKVKRAILQNMSAASRNEASRQTSIVKAQETWYRNPRMLFILMAAVVIGLGLLFGGMGKGIKPWMQPDVVIEDVVIEEDLLTPAEQAEVDRLIAEYGKDALAYYLYSVFNGFDQNFDYIWRPFGLFDRAIEDYENFRKKIANVIKCAKV